MNRSAAIAAHYHGCGESVGKRNNPTCPLHTSHLSKTKRTKIPSQVLLANMPQKQLKALHGEAIGSGDQDAAASISKFMVDRPPQSGCLFCNEDGDYPTKRGTEIVCGNCVASLVDMTQSDLKRAYQLAMRSNQTRKAGAIRKFIEGETTNERTKKKHQRPTERESPLRMAGIGSP